MVKTKAIEKEETRAKQPTYVIEHPQHPESVCTAVYRHPVSNEEGRMFSVLEDMSFGGSSSMQFMNATLKMLPVWVEIGVTSVAPAQFSVLKGKGCTVRDITLRNALFTDFWNAYGYKVGNKKRCEILWNSLRPADRQLALGGIERQRRHSQKHNTDMPYPETYLRQRRWENIFNG